MKRVILIFTLTLFAAGMTIPSAVFAERNNNKAAAFNRDTRDMGQAGTSATQNFLKSWSRSFRHIFTRYFITILPGTGITIIDISWDEPESPLESQFPPGWKYNNPTDRRPDGDDNGWDDTNK